MLLSQDINICYPDLYLHNSAMCFVIEHDKDIFKPLRDLVTIFSKRKLEGSTQDCA